MHAYIITGSPEFQKNKIAELVSTWKIDPFDIISCVSQEQHIGIGDIRAFQKQLSLAPLASPSKVGIIPHAELLTIEAQNAMLKLLEEPPPHTYIICQTPTRDTLLPTVASRCEIIDGGSNATSQDVNADLQLAMTTLLSTSPGNVVAMVEKNAVDRTLAKQWVSDMLEVARLQMITSLDSPSRVDTQNISQLVRRLLVAQRELERNVNPKMVLDWVFLSS